MDGKGWPAEPKPAERAKAGGAAESRTPDKQFRKLLPYPSELQISGVTSEKTTSKIPSLTGVANSSCRKEIFSKDF